MRIQNKKHGIYRVNGGKEYKASRLGGLERVRGGEKVIIAREREKKKERPVQADSQGHASHITRVTRVVFGLSDAHF